MAGASAHVGDRGEDEALVAYRRSLVKRTPLQSLPSASTGSQENLMLQLLQRTWPT